MIHLLYSILKYTKTFQVFQYNATVFINIDYILQFHNNYRQIPTLNNVILVHALHTFSNNILSQQYNDTFTYNTLTGHHIPTPTGAFIYYAFSTNALNNTRSKITRAYPAHCKSTP